MSHRTQITLTDEQYARLREESERSGLGLAALVRRALANTYGAIGSDRTTRALEESFGAWRESGTDGEGYVENIRRGMSRRLEDV